MNNIKFKEITLASVEEVKGLDRNILAAEEPWYLRTPGKAIYRIAVVGDDGFIYENGGDVDASYVYEDDGTLVNDECPLVRPVLRAADPDSIDIEEGDTVYFNDIEWIYIGNGLFLLFDPYVHMPFRKYSLDNIPDDANDYEHSDVKKYLDAWAKENGFEFVTEESAEASKLHISSVPMDVEFSEIRLLTIDEAERIDKEILRCGTVWWLQTPLEDQGFHDTVAGVWSQGWVYPNLGLNVITRNDVRPVLCLAHPESSGLKIGDKIRVADRNWTVVSDRLVLCDEIVGRSIFSDDYEAKDANIYEVSKLKVWLENWAKENGIEFVQPKAESKAEPEEKPSENSKGKVYVYKEYTDTLAYGEELIRVFAKKKDALAFLKKSVELTYDKSMEELANELDPDWNTVEEDYCCIENNDGDSYTHFVVEEHTVD